MLRSLYVTAVYVSFLVFGTAAPFALSLGYVWVDSFRPQDVVWSILNAFPVSAFMGAVAIGGYFLFDRRSPARFTAHTALTLLLAAWVTITTWHFAVSPVSAWTKWDWAIKTILFSAFIPLVFRTMVQIEAFLGVYLFSLCIHIIPVGLKTIISGGGYGRELGVVSGNNGFAEGSTLAGVTLMLVPIVLYLRKNTVLVPEHLRRIFGIGCLGLTGLFLAAAMGTFARTAVIGSAVLGVALWWRSKRKVTGAIVGVLVAAVVGFSASGAWEERISTINDYQSEASALGRIMVWKWTIGFVRDHPAGGGFNAYEVNQFEMPSGPSSTDTFTVKGKAFHSVYFEVLGEHGVPGAMLYGGLILTTLFSLQATARRVRHVPELARTRELAYALQVSFVTLLACGAFIGIAFQPMIFYIFALTACLANNTRRCLAEMRSGASVVARRQRIRFSAPLPAPGIAVPSAVGQGRLQSRSAR